MGSTQTKASEGQWYKGHAIRILPAEGEYPRRVMVRVDDAGPFYREKAVVDWNNTPEWLLPPLGARFQLTYSESGPPEARKRSLIAINVGPQA